MKRGPGGELRLAAPPGRVTRSPEAQPGCVIPGINKRKKIVNVRSRKSTAYTLQRFFECVTDMKQF